MTGPFLLEDPLAAWTHFRPAALALRPEALPICRLDADLARTNTQRGVAAILPLRDKARAHLPQLDVDRALESAALAFALTHAIDRAPPADPSTSATPAPADPDPDHALPLSTRVARMFADRALLVLHLRVCVGVGALAQDTLDQILEDRGPIDGARDVLAAEALLDTDALRDKHPFPAAWRTLTRRRAHRLLAELTPSNAAAAASERDAAGRERDAYAQLLTAAHADLRTIGQVLFGEKQLDAKVPPLQSRTLTRAPAKPTPAAPATP
ncbi:MAG: hypothetical protein JWM10_5435 [Myxococcaceae bacterium]|nr:hypothetical protein [Myxococcaceae bacterium]